METKKYEVKINKGILLGFSLKDKLNCDTQKRSEKSMLKIV